MKEITLPKREAVTDWIELNKKQKIKVDYPTRKQSQQLQDIMLNEYKAFAARMAEYSQYYCKFTIKAWEGFGEELQLIGDEMDDEQWWVLVQDIPTAKELWNMIDKVLKFTLTDKKKLKS